MSSQKLSKATLSKPTKEESFPDYTEAEIKSIQDNFNHAKSKVLANCFKKAKKPEDVPKLFAMAVYRSTTEFSNAEANLADKKFLTEMSEAFKKVDSITDKNKSHKITALMRKAFVKPKNRPHTVTLSDSQQVFVSGDLAELAVKKVARSAKRKLADQADMAKKAKLSEAVDAIDLDKF